jgi:hypothetical protein
MMKYNSVFFELCKSILNICMGAAYACMVDQPAGLIKGQHNHGHVTWSIISVLNGITGKIAIAPAGKGGGGGARHLSPRNFFKNKRNWKKEGKMLDNSNKNKRHNLKNINIVVNCCNVSLCRNIVAVAMLDRHSNGGTHTHTSMGSLP